jgi:hypothetical protein
VQEGRGRGRGEGGPAGSRGRVAWRRPADAPVMAPIPRCRRGDAAAAVDAQHPAPPPLPCAPASDRCAHAWVTVAEIGPRGQRAPRPGGGYAVICGGGRRMVVAANVSGEWLKCACRQGRGWVSAAYAVAGDVGIWPTSDELRVTSDEAAAATPDRAPRRGDGRLPLWTPPGQPEPHANHARAARPCHHATRHHFPGRRRRLLPPPTARAR